MCVNDSFNCQFPLFDGLLGSYETLLNPVANKFVVRQTVLAHITAVLNIPCHEPPALNTQITPEEVTICLDFSRII